MVCCEGGLSEAVLPLDHVAIDSKRILPRFFVGCVCLHHWAVWLRLRRRLAVSACHDEKERSGQEAAAHCHPPSAIVRPTIACPNDHHERADTPRATACELAVSHPTKKQHDDRNQVRNAQRTRGMNHKDERQQTGRVERKTSRNTPAAAFKSSLCRRRWARPLGNCKNRRRSDSISASVSSFATSSDMASKMNRRPSSGDAVWIERNSIKLCPRWLSVPIRYITASMMPQARLHPSAATSMRFTSSWSTPRARNDPVNVSTMISPNAALDGVEQSLTRAGSRVGHGESYQRFRQLKCGVHSSRTDPGCARKPKFPF